MPVASQPPAARARSEKPPRRADGHHHSQLRTSHTQEHMAAVDRFLMASADISNHNGDLPRFGL